MNDSAYSLRWARVEDDGQELCRVTGSAEGWLCEGVVLGGAADETWAVRYRILADPQWHTRQVDVEHLLAPSFLSLRADGAGQWSATAGVAMPQLDGCFDVDLSVTPLTNTLAIRRLGLGVGDAAVIRVAYVDVPSLAVSADEQRYTRRGADRYHFETTDGVFEREISVDAAGFVTDYPGLFRRLDL